MACEVWRRAATRHWKEKLGTPQGALRPGHGGKNPEVAADCLLGGWLLALGPAGR